MKKISSIVISLILCFTVLCQTANAAFWGNRTLYVADIKLIYADNIDKAKEQLPEGYQLLESDLNTGTGDLGVFICYSTTENRDEAITDIKVMHESGGFQRTNFKSSLDEAIDGVYGLAKEMMTAVDEFVQNYNAGLPGAVYAKDALNYFRYDDTTLLGDFMISGKGTYKDYGKMILMCHEDILNPILSMLAFGVQQKAGENWIDKLANLDPTTYDSSYDSKYRARATKLRPVLQQFNDLFCYVVGYYDKTYTYANLTDENDKDLFTQMAGNKDMFLAIQAILQSYSVGVQDTETYGVWTAQDMFTIGLNETMNLYESYALLECLTPGQEIMLRLTGPYNFIIGSQNTEEVIAEARKRLAENLNTNDVIPIWEGVNFDLFEYEVGLTNDAQRSIAAGKQYDIFAKDLDTLAQKYRDIASIISSCLTIASCTVLVAKCSLVLLPKFFTAISCYAVAGAISTFASSAIVTTIIATLGITFTVCAVVCTIIIMFFLEDIIAWMLKEEYERSSIPVYMVDETLNKEGISTYAYYRRVENVKTDKELGLDTGDNESGSDINANSGYRWMALYTSSKSSVGNPIKADFKIESSTGTNQEGYVPLSMFGNVNAMNLNSYADKSSTKYPAVYLHYVQDQTTPVEDEKIYISDIVVESGKHEDEAKTKLENRGFIVFNHDFGCRKGESTFIGYKLTAHARDAVRDIRLMYNLTSSSVDYGEIDYADAGKIGNFSLMISRAETNPASPIKHLAVYERNVLPEDNLGYEPVNEFSGGMAHPLGRSKYRLYFMPEVTFTEGPDYLAGIKTDVYYYNTFSAVTYYHHPFRDYDHTDMFENNVDNYRAYKLQTYREQFFDFNSSASYYFQARENADSHNTVNIAYKYTTTKNPYRALYGIGANIRNGADRFNDTVTYAGVGFVLAAAEFSSASRLYTGDKFVYSPAQNKNEFGNVIYSLYEYTGDTREYYTAAYSPGKADAWAQDLNWKFNDTIHSNDYVFNMDITQAFYNDDMNAIYLSGYQADKTPLTVDDIIISDKLLTQSELSTTSSGLFSGGTTIAAQAKAEGKYPANFTPVCSMLGSSPEATNVAPSNGEAFAGTYSGDRKIYVTLYNKVYMYFRNEKTVNGKVVAQPNLKNGKYISDVIVTSREEIRESHNSTSKTGEQIKCKDINKATVENNLFNKNATSTYDIHINTNFSKSDGFENANYTYLGIQRTDNPDNAIRDIRLYIAEKGERPLEDIERVITDSTGDTYKVQYHIAGRASLTEQGNKSAENCAKERQVYVYFSTHPQLGAPITEIKMTDMFSYDDYEPVLTMDSKHFVTAYRENKKAGGASIFVDDDYFMHGNQISVKREGVPDKPYVESVMSFATGDKYDSISKLLEAGYTDVIKKDMNAGTAAGKYIYVGMKRTADINNAMYGLLATTEYGKKPPETRGSHTLVSKDDLNKNTNIGKYIYLYQSKTKQLLDTSPITDIKAVGKSYTINEQETTGETIYINGGIGVGDISYKEEFVLNQSGSKQDMNQGAFGDYIYLVMTRELRFENQLYYLGSMLGTGSIVVIGLFLVAAVGAIVYVKRKKKRENAIAENETTQLV